MARNCRKLTSVQDTNVNRGLNDKSRNYVYVNQYSQQHLIMLTHNTSLLRAL
jgi:hypothetical protein